MAFLFTVLIISAKPNDTIVIRPIGQISDTTIFHFLKNELNKIFKIPVRIEKPVSIDSSCYNEDRDQYYSPLLLKRLSSKNPNEIVLGIVSVDLYVEGLNFIFGQASLTERKAIISLIRLKQESYGLKPNPTLFKRRTLTEAVHELGHIYGLNHCSNPRCVMFFSNSLKDTDYKGFEFCPNCRNKIFGNK